MRRHLARSDSRRNTASSRLDEWPGNELLNCVVREQHDFAASTQSAVHGLSTYLPIYLSVCLSIYTFIYLSIYISIYPSLYPSIYLSIYLVTYLSIFLLFIYLHFCMSVCLAMSVRFKKCVCHIMHMPCNMFYAIFTQIALHTLKSHTYSAQHLCLFLTKCLFFVSFAYSFYQLCTCIAYAYLIFHNYYDTKKQSNNPISP